MLSRAINTKNMDDKTQTETQWAKKLKYSSVEHHLEKEKRKEKKKKLFLLTAFQLAKRPFRSPTWWKLLE